MPNANRSAVCQACLPVMAEGGHVFLAVLGEPGDDQVTLVADLQRLRPDLGVEARRVQQLLTRVRVHTGGALTVVSQLAER